jgi:ABC-type branched-subunit amino acid transport system ATPase component
MPQGNRLKTGKGGSPPGEPRVLRGVEFRLGEGEALAPLIRAEICDCLTRLKAEGQSIPAIDKNLKPLLDFVDRIAVIEKGRIVWRGSAGEFRAEPWIVDRFIRVGGVSAPAVPRVA